MAEGEVSAGEQFQPPVEVAIVNELSRTAVGIRGQVRLHRKDGGAAVDAAGLVYDFAIDAVSGSRRQAREGEGIACRAGDRLAVFVPLVGVLSGPAGRCDADRKGRAAVCGGGHGHVFGIGSVQHGKLVAFAAAPDNEAFTHVIAPPSK